MPSKVFSCNPSFDSSAGVCVRVWVCAVSSLERVEVGSHIHLRWCVSQEEVIDYISIQPLEMTSFSWQQTAGSWSLFLGASQGPSHAWRHQPIFPFSLSFSISLSLSPLPPPTLTLFAYLCICVFIFGASYGIENKNVQKIIILNKKSILKGQRDFK